MAYVLGLLSKENQSGFTNMCFKCNVSYTNASYIHTPLRGENEVEGAMCTEKNIKQARDGFTVVFSFE